MSGQISPLLVAHTDTRRTLAGNDGPFDALADGLIAELEPLLHAPLPIPSFKARLTRIGGRCPVHGVLLDFEPMQPHDHRCPRCQINYRGIEHDQWWAMGAQLYTAERAVHAASVFALRGDARHADLAARILRAYTEQYETWPNRDNVLGPSRPFFSTYLESLWLLNLCHAAALLETHAATWSTRDAQQLRAQVLDPSARLIEGYHEGRSNRQVWNEVALCSAWCLLGRADDARVRLASPIGLTGLISEGLDADGFWYEGENYHMFAHRGLWYGVTLMQALGCSLSPEQERRYRAGFVAPFLGVLPDETFPSRRDSQYASSIRQWRTAEWCELGWAHAHDPSLVPVLASIYRDDGERGETGRRTSTADAERNWPGSRLSRADLSWRALLMAEGALPTGALPSGASNIVAPRFANSVAVPAHGLAIVRRDEGAVYVALDGGRSGGGHGHPDQLSLTMQRGSSRWLDDPGTGSYVEAKLAWYRSTLAHHAPFLDDRSQRATHAHLVAFHDDLHAQHRPSAVDGAARAGDVASATADANARPFAWIVKSVHDLAPGTTVRRTIVVGDGYVVDCVEWEGDEPHTLTLPIAGACRTQGDDVAWQPIAVPATERDDPAWSFVREPVCVSLDRPLAFVAPAFSAPLRSSVRPVADEPHDEASREAAIDAASDAASDYLHGWYAASDPVVWSRGIVQAAPGLGETSRLWLTSRAARGRIVGVLSWGRAVGDQAVVRAVEFSHLSASSMSLLVVGATDTADTHQFIDGRWQVTTAGCGARDLFVISTPLLHSLASVIEDEENVRDVHNPPIQNITVLKVADWREMLPKSATDSRGTNALQSDGLFTLGADHYVPTELPWTDAGAPTARVHVAATTEHLVVSVHAQTGHALVTTDEGVNPLDNEPHATNADGLQWYMQAPLNDASHDDRWDAAGLVAISHSGDAIHRQLGRLAPSPEVSVTSLADGWHMVLRWPLREIPVGPDRTLDVELVVNERPLERERRRGQLVLSGGGGFGYLAGARRPRSRYVRLLGVPRPSEAASA